MTIFLRGLVITGGLLLFIGFLNWVFHKIERGNTMKENKYFLCELYVDGFGEFKNIVKAKTYTKAGDKFCTHLLKDYMDSFFLDTSNVHVGQAHDLSEYPELEII